MQQRNWLGCFPTSLEFVRWIQKKFWICWGIMITLLNSRVTKNCYMLSITMLFYHILKNKEISIFAMYTLASVYPVCGIISQTGFYNPFWRLVPTCYMLAFDINLAIHFDYQKLVSIVFKTFKSVSFLLYNY